MATVKLARPGVSTGLASLPVRTTRLAAPTAGRGGWWRRTDSPLASGKDLATGKFRGREGPGWAGGPRRGRSRFTASTRVPVGPFSVLGGGPPDRGPARPE